VILRQRRHTAFRKADLAETRRLPATAAGGFFPPPGKPALHRETKKPPAAACHFVPPFGCGPVGSRPLDSHRGRDGRGPEARREDIMICGNFTPTEQGFTGEIRFFGQRGEQVALLPIEGQDNEKAPNFRIVAADDERIEFGAAWRKKSKEGRDYISFKLNPVIAAPVYLRLFLNETTGGYELVAD
jgi:uncharacterized protein (DUF736 family)